MKSIIQQDAKCFYCRMAMATETHHIFGGPNRRFSDEDGLTVRLFRQCHDALHHDPNLSAPMQKALHQLGQQKWEATYGTEGKARDQFRARYGRNYL